MWEKSRKKKTKLIIRKRGRRGKGQGTYSARPAFLTDLHPESRGKRKKGKKCGVMKKAAEGKKVEGGAVNL